MYSAKFASALLLSFFHSASPTIADETAWMQARSANTHEAYRTYLRAQPNGSYIGVAYHQLRHPPTRPAFYPTGLMQLAEFCRANDPRLACLLGTTGAQPERSQLHNNNENTGNTPYRGNVGMGNKTTSY